MKTFIIVWITAAYWLQGSWARPTAAEGSVHHHDVDTREMSTNAMSKRVVREAQTCDCDARVFDGPNFSGRLLSITQQNADFTNDFFNDRVESIQIDGKCKWIFYEHENFLGSAHILSAAYHSSAPSWGGAGNRISSARVLPSEGTKAIVLFQHTNFRGRMEVVMKSNGRLPSLDFNDHVSSIIVIGGTWNVYDDGKFQGKRTRLNVGEYPDIHLSHIGGDTVSSVELVKDELGFIEELEF